MKKMLLLVAAFVFLLSSRVGAQVSAPTTIDVRDEGTSQGFVRIVNFTGSSVACSVASGVATCNITGGGSASVTVASLDMTGETKKRFTITDAAVTPTSKVVISVRRPDTLGPDDYGYTYVVNVLDLNAGSFDVLVRVDDPDADIEPPTETIEVHYVLGT